MRLEEKISFIQKEFSRFILGLRETIESAIHVPSVESFLC